MAVGTYSREMRQWTYVVGNVSRYRETTLAVVCREGVVRRVRKRDWQEFGENEGWSTFMIVECELQPWAQVANVDSLVVAAIDIAPEATMLTRIELLRSFGKAFWCVGPVLENNGVRTDVAAWFPWVDTRGAMRCLSEWTEAFLRDGGVARESA